MFDITTILRLRISAIFLLLHMTYISIIPAQHLLVTTILIILGSIIIKTLFPSLGLKFGTVFPKAISPVPELSFLPAPYRDWTRAGERRVQDNLHAHVQNAANFSPKTGEKPYLEVFSRFGLWRNFLNDIIQATISAFRLIKNMSINPKSVEFHQCHAKPHSTCFFFLSQCQR